MDHKDNCKPKHQLFNIKLLIQNVVTDLPTVVFSSNVQTFVSKAINIENKMLFSPDIYHRAMRVLSGGFLATKTSLVRTCKPIFYYYIKSACFPTELFMHINIELHAKRICILTRVVLNKTMFGKPLCHASHTKQLKVVRYGCSICGGMMLVRDVGIITVLLKCSIQN